MVTQKDIDRINELARKSKTEGLTDAEKAEALLCWMEETNQRMGLPNSFDMIREEDIDQMVSWAMTEAHPLYPVPVIWRAEDFRTFIRGLRS